MIKTTNDILIMQKKYTFIDLFAGCGGLIEGFLQTQQMTREVACEYAHSKHITRRAVH